MYTRAAGAGNRVPHQLLRSGDGCTELQPPIIGLSGKAAAVRKPHVSDRRPLREQCRVIARFVGRPCRARDVRQPRHLDRHLRRYVDTRGLAVVFGRIGNVSAERLQEDRNAVAPTSLLGDA
jgi:hypothetical protein